MAGDGLTAEERAAMKETMAERRTAARRAKSADKAAADLQDVLGKIAEMDDADRALAEAFHRVVTSTAPDLAPRTWYGMPAYAKDGKVLCFFQAASKFGARYATFGFQDVAALDDGSMWPTSFALVEVGDAEERAIAELVRRAVG